MPTLREYTIAMTRRVYGPSNIRNLSHGSHVHDFTDGRSPSPGYGNDGRSLAVLECDECAEFAVEHYGFSTTPKKVRLTHDEAEYNRELKERADAEKELRIVEILDRLAEQGIARGNDDRDTVIARVLAELDRREVAAEPDFVAVDATGGEGATTQAPRRRARATSE